MSRTFRYDKESQAPKFAKKISKRFNAKKLKKLSKFETSYIEIHPTKRTSIQASL